MYDGRRAFGKEWNRVKYMGGKTPFHTRGNNYYVSNLWYKKEVGTKNRYQRSPQSSCQNTQKKKGSQWKGKIERGRNGSVLHTGLENPKMTIRIIHHTKSDSTGSHPSWSSMLNFFFVFGTFLPCCRLHTVPLLI